MNMTSPYAMTLQNDNQILLKYSKNAMDDNRDQSRDEGCFREEIAFFDLLIPVNVDFESQSMLWAVLMQRISRDLSVRPGLEPMTYLIYVRLSSSHASDNSLDKPWDFRHHVNFVEPLT